jgi:pyruvate dehydrogenase E1 component alpha subunit
MTAPCPRSSTPPAVSRDVVRALTDDGSLDEQHDPRLSDEEMLHLYRSMVITRQLDERFVMLQRQGRIGFHVGSLGEEAAIIGSAFALRPKDWVFPCYREFGAALMRGLPLQCLVDNVFGNAGDMVKGRQMPHHYTCRRIGWASVSSPVGTQITQGVGYAWAAKMQKTGEAALIYFGDGATSSVDFHSGMNFAGVFRTPAVFLCRNNGWAISVPTERQTASRTLAEKAHAYGMPGIRVDGNDILAVVSVTRRAVARAVSGLGPTLIEAITYRVGAHTTSDDPNRYRQPSEVEPWMQYDPIQRFREFLAGRGLWDDTAEQALVAEIDVVFRAAVTQAEATPAPSLSSMFDDVYAKLPWHLAEQRSELLLGPRPTPLS